MSRNTKTNSEINSKNIRSALSFDGANGSTFDVDHLLQSDSWRNVTTFNEVGGIQNMLNGFTDKLTPEKSLKAGKIKISLNLSFKKKLISFYCKLFLF